MDLQIINKLYTILENDNNIMNEMHKIITTNKNNIVEKLQAKYIELSNDVHNIIPNITQNLIPYKKGGVCDIYKIKDMDNYIVKEWVIKTLCTSYTLYTNNNIELKFHNHISEPLINVIIKKIINNNICINFVKTYKTIINNELTKEYLIMESCDGDLVEFEKIMGRQMTVNDYINALIQIFYALYILKHNNIIHTDLHYKNILIKKINSAYNKENTKNTTMINGINTENIEAFSYIIDEETFTIPNLGFIIKICDFGTSHFEIKPNLWIVPICGRVSRNSNYDLLTIFLSVININNLIHHNVRKECPIFFSNEIITINSDIVNTCLTTDIHKISNGDYRPYMNTVNCVKPLIEICRYVYSKSKFDNNYSRIVEFKNK